MSEILRKHPGTVFRDRIVEVYPEQVIVQWEYTQHPKHLFSIFLDGRMPLSMKLMYVKVKEAMLRPRMFEVSEILGKAGLAKVTEGIGYLFISNNVKFPSWVSPVSTL